MTISLDKYNFSDDELALFVENINDIIGGLNYVPKLPFSKRLATLLVYHGFFMSQFPDFMDPNLPMQKILELCCGIGSLSMNIVGEHGLEKLKAHLETFTK